MNITLLKQTLILPILFAIAGCQESNPFSAEVADYQKRISNIIQVPYNEISVQPSRFPQKRDLVIPLKPISIDWQDFFSVNQCADLQQLIAHRNSQLGKNMEAATRLLYEKKLLLQLTSCIKKLNTASNKVKTALETKQQQFKPTVWNNTWASNYWQKILSNSMNHRAVDKQSINNLVTQVSQLRETLLKQDVIEKQHWFARFQTMENSVGVIGSIVFEMEYHIKVIGETSLMLSKELNAICPNNSKSKQFKYLNNVLNKFYLQSIQKRQVELLEIYSSIEEEFSKWIQFFPNEQMQFKEWFAVSFKQDSNSNLNNRFRQSILEHVQVWQSIRDNCGINQ